MHKPEGAKFPLKVFGDSSWVTYADVQQRAYGWKRAAGARPRGPCRWTRAEGDQRLRANHRPAHVLIFEETCADWLTACVGCMGQSVTVATSYATLGMPAVAEALNETNAPVIISTTRTWRRSRRWRRSARS